MLFKALKSAKKNHTLSIEHMNNEVGNLEVIPTYRPFVPIEWLTHQDDIGRNKHAGHASCV